MDWIFSHVTAFWVVALTASVLAHLWQWIGWDILAILLAHPGVVRWLKARAECTPYSDIHDSDGSLYMARWWLFNPYDRSSWMRWLPSIRLHWIRRPDRDRHLHDHPWTFRTFILDGWYAEQREGLSHWHFAGDTSKLKHGEFHRITAMPATGVWTLFVTYRKRSTWGFLVNGGKVPYREYLGL